jgi:hypothetical protein
MGKKLGISAVLSAAAIAAFAGAQSSSPSVRRDIHHDVSRPLRELARAAPGPSVAAALPRELEEDAEEAARRAAESSDLKENAAFKEMPAMESQPAREAIAHASAVAPAVGLNVTMELNFDGLTDTSLWSVPDNDGAVGDTQYVQWVNVQYAVYNKATGARILGPLAGTTLWKGFGGPCQTAKSGDPIVQFPVAVMVDPPALKVPPLRDIFPLTVRLEELTVKSPVRVPPVSGR